MNNSPVWYIYMLLCADGSLYTGITTDCERRLKEHNGNNKLGAKYTRARRPVVLVWKEASGCRSLAGKREYQIKQYSREKKLALIDACNRSNIK